MLVLTHSLKFGLFLVCSFQTYSFLLVSLISKIKFKLLHFYCQIEFFLKVLQCPPLVRIKTNSNQLWLLNIEKVIDHACLWLISFFNLQLHLYIKFKENKMTSSISFLFKLILCQNDNNATTLYCLLLALSIITNHTSWYNFSCESVVVYNDWMVSYITPKVIILCYTPVHQSVYLSLF